MHHVPEPPVRRVDNTSFALDSAAQHPHGLVLSNNSVHTSIEALRRGEQ